MGTVAGLKTGREILETLKSTVDLILPYRCQVCGKVSDTEERFSDYGRLYNDLYGKDPELHICGQCLSSISILDDDRRWSLCLSDPVGNDVCPGLALYMPFAYRGIVETAVPKIKFSKKIELARLFGCLLGSCLKTEGVAADLVVPVPLSPERLAERGFNQASEIAYPVAKINGIRFVDDLLIRTRNTKRQSGISDKNERRSNVNGAFGVSDDWDVTGMKIIIIDDVATTGATLHEAAKALYGAGAAKVICAAFAGNRQADNAEPF